MLRVLVGLSIILLVLSPVSAFRVTEFAPDTYLPRDADSYFVLEGTGSLDNVSITDGEGTIWFPRGMYARGRVTVADEALAFREIHGIFPDYEVRETVSAVPDMGRRGPFALANGKDELTLLERGVVVQEVRWPGDVHPREGQVHFLSGSAWDPRVLLIGQSTFALERFTNVTVTAFVSPDSSFRIMEEAILAARSEILVNAYELTHSGIGELLSTARRRGVSVRVLLEGGPVGGISAEERSVCAAMNRSGIPLLIMTTTDSAHARYRYNHAVYYT